MDTLTFIAIWVLLSFPIVYSVTKRLKQDEEFGGELPAGFQIYLFILATTKAYMVIQYHYY